MLCHRLIHLTKCRIAASDFKQYLKGIEANNLFQTGTLEEKAAHLQRKFENLVADDKSITEKAGKGKRRLKCRRIIVKFINHSNKHKHKRTNAFHSEAIVMTKYFSFFISYSSSLLSSSSKAT